MKIRRSAGPTSRRSRSKASRRITTWPRQRTNIELMAKQENIPMSDQLESIDGVATYERPLWSSWRRQEWTSSVPMIILIALVGFLVLTPLFLMILNSFQTARPGRPIVWGFEGWVTAFTTPGIVQAMTNTFTL